MKNAGNTRDYLLPVLRATRPPQARNLSVTLCNKIVTFKFLQSAHKFLGSDSLKRKRAPVSRRKKPKLGVLSVQKHPPVVYLAQNNPRFVFDSFTNGLYNMHCTKKSYSLLQ